MRDINLNSRPIVILDFPVDTASIMIMYDERGWAIRCYDQQGEKITTMIPDDNADQPTLVSRELLNGE